MAEAAYATGPALLGAPRFWGPRASLFYFFSWIFCFLFQRGAQTVRQSGAPKSLSPPENLRPKKSAPNVFFLFPVLVFLRGAPKSPRSPENVIGPQNLKTEVPKCGATNDFFVPCFSAGSKQRGALNSPRPPKAKLQTKKNARPQS
jgi:hypothetical protein